MPKESDQKNQNKSKPEAVNIFGQTNVYDSHIVQELVKYVDGRPGRLEYLKKCIIPFFEVAFFADNIDNGKDLIKQIILKENEDHV